MYSCKQVSHITGPVMQGYIIADSINYDERIYLDAVVFFPSLLIE